ncbi:hypothetical protein [Allosphingosinicella sp.]|jgi:glutathione S-transferase|uniref:hypothetical protein n=1 Tax=Allosphingosinicella sp. TaxID=2823234 RepID=UPI002F04EF66
MTRTKSRADPILLTFEPMVDSQCARLVLAHYGLRYRERDYMLGWGSLVALVRFGTARLPVLAGGGITISSPRPMAEHFEKNVPEERKLIPAPGALRYQVEADWALYNGKMGGWTAQFAYFHLLPERRLMTRIFRKPVPPIQRALTGPLYPLLRLVVKAVVGIGPAQAGQALAQIRSTFDSTDARIADGRRYLNGDRATLGDIALAAAAAPLLCRAAIR